MNDDKLSKFRLEHIGFIFQSFNLIPELSVRENICLPFTIAGRRRDSKRFAGIVQTLGLTDRLNHLPQQLSGGQQQRVAIARALINQPEVLLCDEPTGNLDKVSGENVMALLQQVNREYGITILMITHDPKLAGMTSRTLVISDGKIA